MSARPTVSLLLIAAFSALNTKFPGNQPSASIHVRVLDTASGTPLPCRLTVVDSQGNLAEVRTAKRPELAVRQGVIYTSTGAADLSLPPGKYTLYATRGMEYSLARAPLDVTNKETNVTLKLTREVDTTGYVASDTHIHTLTYSGHGDSTAEERAVTLAGEGIELPIFTEHNRHVDFSEALRKTGTPRWMTPVIGNEVTTAEGHFNILPVRPEAKDPDPKLSGWSALLGAIRATPGGRFVILNHPSDTHVGFCPTDPKRLHPLSGESLDDRDWDFNGMEVVGSAALQSAWMKPYRDWFAQLNRGRKIIGIGASDSHDVNTYIVGQGRTYVASAAKSPDRIDVDEACTNLLAGKALVSMGLFTEMWVDGKSSVGEMAIGTGKLMRLRVKVQGPKWITADRVEVFANGQKILSRPIIHKADAVTKLDLTVTLPRPKQDQWLVAIASGPGVREPYWPIARPYQPRRGDWDPVVIGSTSPIFVDGDGDGRYSSPLDIARKAADAAGLTSADQAGRFLTMLAPYDEAVAVQAASLWRQRGLNLSAPPLQRALDSATGAVRHGFVAYRNLLTDPVR